MDRVINKLDFLDISTLFTTKFDHICHVTIQSQKLTSNVIDI
ncbi:hypothetical protein [Anabaena sp. WA102]|jgi:hypothetical protein|nr:hypothetical protein [Anabaena sp. WA102]